MDFRAMRRNKYVELLSTNNKTMMDQWKIHSGVKKEYDAQSKTYVYNVSGNSPVVKMHLPKDKKQKLGLYYPLLVLQLWFPIKANILCDIGITTCNSQRKRITLSSNQKFKQNTLLFTVLPFTIINSIGWINVLVDIEEITSDLWNNLKVKSIDFLSLSGVFRLKRIFLLSRDMIHFKEGIFVVNYDQLPKQMSLSKNILQCNVYITSSYPMGKSPKEYSSRESTSEAILSKNSSRTSFSERFPSTHVKTLAMKEKYFTTFKQKNFDLNLSILTFTNKITDSQQEISSEEISTESNASASNLKESVIKNERNIELCMPL